MKFRNQFLKYKLHMKDGDGGDGDSGGGGGSGGDGNTDEANLLSHDTMWDTTDDAGSDADKGGEGGAGSGGETLSANEQFDAHIGTLDFNAGIDVQATMAAISSGDAEAFSKALTQIGVNAYKNAMIDSNKAAQYRIDQSATAVKSEINANSATGEIVNAMQTTLPFTKSAQFAPVAKLLLTQFMSKGAKPEQAIEQVGKYFQNIQGEMQKMNPAAPNSQASGGFQGVVNNGDANGNGDEVDWQEMLGGAPQ